MITETTGSGVLSLPSRRPCPQPPWQLTRPSALASSFISSSTVAWIFMEIHQPRPCVELAIHCSNLTVRNVHGNDPLGSHIA